MTRADHGRNATYILGRTDFAGEPRSVDICTSQDECLDNLVIPTRRRSVQGEDASKNRVDGLALANGILNQPEVAGGTSPV
jgi:hypothetical protein